MSDTLFTEIPLIPEIVGSSIENNPLGIFKGPRMTKEFLKNHCKENRLYQTPHLNDVLYLHFKGFSFIENLGEYTGLKCLWLENNGLKEISGLDHQQALRSLFLHYNLIKKIENLENCPILDTLNISHNQLKTIENLDCLKSLHTLNIANNYVESLEDFEHLEKLLELSVLDLANNHIDDPLIVQTLGGMPGLRVLNLMGNPVIRKIPAYRKTLILACANLQYLDDRPVFPRERACAEAWQRGGITEEHAERKRWIDRERQKIMYSVNALIKMRDAKGIERTAQDNAQILDSGFCTSVGDSESEAGSLSHPNLEVPSFARNSAMCNSPDNGEPLSDKERKIIYRRNVAVEDSSGENETSSASSDTDSDDDIIVDRKITENDFASRTRIFDFSCKAPVCNQKRLVEEIEFQPCTTKQAPVENESIDIDEETKVTTREDLEVILTTNPDIAKRDFNLSLLKVASNGSENEGGIKTQDLEDQNAFTIEFVENLMDKHEAKNGSQLETNKFEYLENLISSEVQTGRTGDGSVDNIERSEELNANAKASEENVSATKKDHVGQIGKLSVALSEPVTLKPKTVFTINRDQNLEDDFEDSDDSKIEESGRSDNENEEKAIIERQSAFALDVDKCETINASSMEAADGNFTILVKTKKKFQASPLDENCKYKELEDVSYKELLNYNINISGQNRMALQFTNRKWNKQDDESKREVNEMILQSKKKKEPESKKVPPKDIIEKDDNALEFFKSHQEYGNNDRVMNEMEQDEERIIKIDNSMVVSNAIVEVKKGMCELNKKFEEFQEKDRLARQNIIDDYNETLEKEIKIIDKFRELQNERPKRTSLSKVLTTPGAKIRDEYLKKHFSDMGMYLPEDIEGELIFQRTEVASNGGESTTEAVVDSPAERQFLAELKISRKIVEEEEGDAKRSGLNKKEELVKIDGKKIVEKNIFKNLLLEDDADDATMEEAEAVCVVKRNVSRSLEMQLAQERNNIK
ncbi:dynein axonemal assembly factor 1 homolog [Euwallacea fornicatus]|uniref:dynein axonemal assembly factor 1 homolog n=1 Tax=Euwallacea fornicatus TaxID=995702 RepID=UPI00339041C7